MSQGFDDAKYDRWLSRIEFKIDRILTLLTTQGRHLMSLADEISRLTNDVAAQNTVVGSVQTLLGKLTALIESLKGQVSDPNTLAQLDSLITQLEANTAALSSAVTANTPAA